MKNYSSLTGTLFKKMICGGAAQLKAHSAEVNNLNVFPVPDGDTGDNMTLTVSAGVSAVRSNDSDSLGEIASLVSRGMLLGARGNSGVILSQLFYGISKGLKNAQSADCRTFADALACGVREAYSSVANPTEGTVLTVAREGIGNATAALTPDSTVNGFVDKIKSEMFSSLSKTPDLLPVLKEAGVVDSGGAGLYYIFDGMARTLAGEEISDGSSPDFTSGNEKGVEDYSAFTEDSVMTYGYCTEFLLRLQSSKVDIASFDHSVITDYLSSVGDSVVSWRDGSIVKVHVHTKEPEKVLAFCRRFGEFLTMKIENMSLEHNESISDAPKNDSSAEKAEPEKEYGIVAVCSGDGIKNTFSELGVDCIIDGGQTNNPSVDDFLDAFTIVGARHIFVFPNNSNVILAAKQAARIYSESEIHVIENGDIGSGYVGIASLDCGAESTDGIINGIYESMQNVVTGYLTTAVRTTDIDGVHIENGDYISFVGKKMISADKDRFSSLQSLADSIFEGGGKFMCTVFCGSVINQAECDAFQAYMKKKYPDMELYPVYGGQDVYDFILIAE